MMEIIIFNSHDPKNHVSFYQHFVSICHNIIIIHELLHFFFFLTPRMLIFIKLLCLAFIFSFLMKFPTLCFSNRFSPVIIFDKKKKKHLSVHLLSTFTLKMLPPFTLKMLPLFRAISKSKIEVIVSQY